MNELCGFKINPVPVYEKVSNHPIRGFSPYVRIYKAEGLPIAYLQVVYNGGKTNQVLKFDGEEVSPLSQKEGTKEYGLTVLDQLIGFIDDNGVFTAAGGNELIPTNSITDRGLDDIMYEIYHGVQSTSKFIGGAMKVQGNLCKAEKDLFGEKAQIINLFPFMESRDDLGCRFVFYVRDFIGIRAENGQFIGFTDSDPDLYGLLLNVKGAYLDGKDKNYITLSFSGDTVRFASMVWLFWNYRNLERPLESLEEAKEYMDIEGIAGEKSSFHVDHLTNNTADNRRLSLAAMPAGVNSALRGLRLRIRKPWYFFTIGSDYPEINGVFVEAGNDETKLVQRFKFGDMRKPENANAYLQCVNEFIEYAGGAAEVIEWDDGKLPETSLLYQATHPTREAIAELRLREENPDNEQSDEVWEAKALLEMLSHPHKDPLYNLSVFATENPGKFQEWEPGSFEHEDRFAKCTDVLNVLPVQPKGKLPATGFGISSLL